MHWTRETFVVDQRPSYRFQVVGNRYTPVADTNSEYYAPERRLSLVFLHGTNLFKECFEPIIELLFQRYPTIHSDSGENLILEEAWSIECPNHGESAILNAEDIRRESTGP
ncbi:hypothetical protein SISNIDRAFT_111616 [Sistotremastrum niveocremeum HHB9708]|uniref:Alpha/beta-hydrolase n=1 Tax=Sistotremastrum niveocremeum HHB9708 TaxID=1314777 RepID=A0A164TI24_9AGAM|nr:hypothetical protein SISNIDRAFT_111616 [Sistotremastrum niveocremeum HHB9708]